MLVVSRKPGEKILIGDAVKITIVRFTHNAVRIGIDAPRHMNIVREELRLEVAETQDALIEIVMAQHEGPLEADGGPPGAPVLGGTIGEDFA